MKKVITFVGAGNMARSLVAGLIQDESDVTIRVSDPDTSQCDLVYQYSSDIQVYDDNHQAIDGSDVVVFAVKPQIMKMVCEPLAEIIQQKQPLVVSIAAGVTLKSFYQWLGGECAAVRCMPNTPALVQAGATGLYANYLVTDAQRSLAESIMRAVGLTVWLENESLLDAVTAVSGSGPAYFFLFMESMQQAAVDMGLDEEQARLLVLQTAFGSAKLALESDDDVSLLRQKVTSKGGTTEAALKQFNEAGFQKIVDLSMKAAQARAVQLSQG